MSDKPTDLFEDPNRTSQRVLPLIEDEGNRNQLINWLDSHDSLESVAFDGDLMETQFDVCILDEEALHHYQTELAQLKEEVQPVIIPSLLLLPESTGRGNAFDRKKLTGSDSSAPIDEIASLPVKQKELEWRLNTLLRLREQSIQAYTRGRRYHETKQQLHDIIRKNVPFDQKAREALELGARYLDTDVGLLNRVDAESGYIEATITADLTDGQLVQDIENDLSERYCRETINKDDPLPIYNAPDQGWGDDPAFTSSGIHTYLGIPLIIDDEPYGTVCFIGKDARSEPFSETETRFAEHLCRLLERELDRELLESKLSHQSSLSTVLNRVLRHNLRNDINVIRGHLEIFADQADDNLDLETPLNKINSLLDLTEKARRLDQIVSSSTDRRHTEMGAFMTELVNRFAEEYPNASIAVECDDEIHVSVLETFDRAIEELVGNALKHSGEQPTVTIDIEPVPNAVEIRIQDDGPGLPSQEATVLREGVETSLAHGSGLGLWSAYWIIDSHDGTIDAEVTAEGTRIKVTIPRKYTVGIQEQQSELTKSVDKYKTVFEQVKDLLVILNDEGQILEANPAAGDLLGVDEQELLGQPIRDFLPDELNFDSVWQDFLKMGTIPEEMPIITADGEKRLHEHSGTVDIIPGQHLFVGRDVTEKKQREEELRETKQRLDLALEGADAGVWEWNIETDDLVWDETMEQLFGLPPGTFEGTLEAFIKRVHPEDRNQLNSDIQTALDENEQFESEYRIQRDDGEQYWVNGRGELFSNGETDRMVGIVTDITERKEREREMTSLKERYETLLDAAPDPVFVADAETEELLDVNAAAASLLEKSRDQLIGSYQTTLHPTADTELYREAFQQIAGEQTTIRTLPDGSHLELITDIGETVPVEISVDTVSLPEQSVVFGIFRDISDQLEREAELRIKTRAIEKAPIGIALSDPDQDDNPFVYANEQFHELTGYGESAIGRNCRYLQGEETDPDTVSRIRQAIENEESIREVILNYRKDGTPFWNRLTIAPIRDDTGELVNWVGFQEDVTQEIAREEVLEERTQQLEAVIQTSPDGIIATDPDGTVRLWNDAAEELFGYDADTVKGEPIQSLGLHCGDQQSEFNQLFERVIEGEELTNHEIRRETKDGDRIQLSLSIAPITDESGTITGVMGIAKKQSRN